MEGKWKDQERQIGEGIKGTNQERRRRGATYHLRDFHEGSGEILRWALIASRRVLGEMSRRNVIYGKNHID